MIYQNRLLLWTMLFGALNAAPATPEVQAAAASGRVLEVCQTPLPDIPSSLQFRTIEDAAKIVQPGDTVLIHTGIYHESVEIEESGTSLKPITFEAAPNAQVIVTGADIVPFNALTKVDGPDNIYTTPWDHVFIDSPTQSYPSDQGHVLAGRCEQVFANGFSFRQVLSRGQLARGTFYVDQPNKLLYLWHIRDIPMSDVTVEASVRPIIWDCDGNYVVTKGIRFQYAANRAQLGPVQFKGHDTASYCVFEDMNASGVSFEGPDNVVSHCVIQNNGQLGFGAALADGLLVDHCTIRFNDTKGYDGGWEAGPDKICESRNVVVQNCVITDNRGNGVWFDISNQNATVRNCYIARNDGGIFYEISSGLHACDNVIVDNGMDVDVPGAWGAQAGIVLSSSPNCVVERNLIIGNKEGFNFREQGRTAPVLGDPSGKSVWTWNHNDTIRNNCLAYNRDAQVWGWFDVLDDRIWPRSMQTHPADFETQARPVQDVAAGYTAGFDQQDPNGKLTLETLYISFAGNAYSTDAGQPLFNWGAGWRRWKSYTSLQDLRKELKFEESGAMVSADFADAISGDFRVPAASALLKMGCYPKGSVPSVTLGIIAPDRP